MFPDGKYYAVYRLLNYLLAEKTYIYTYIHTYIHRYRYRYRYIDIDIQIQIQIYRYIDIYICTKASLSGDREEYITQEDDGQKIFENLKTPYISFLNW